MRPPSTVIVVQVPASTLFQALPWKSTVRGAGACGARACCAIVLAGHGDAIAFLSGGGGVTGGSDKLAPEMAMATAPASAEAPMKDFCDMLFSLKVFFKPLPGLVLPAGKP
jgi:hypothetical protein